MVRTWRRRTNKGLDYLSCQTKAVNSPCKNEHHRRTWESFKSYGFAQKAKIPLTAVSGSFKSFPPTQYRCELQKSPKRQFGDRSSPLHLSISKPICLNVSGPIKQINRSNLNASPNCRLGYL